MMLLKDFLSQEEHTEEFCNQINSLFSLHGARRSYPNTQIKKELEEIVKEFPRTETNTHTLVIPTEEIWLSNVNLGAFDLHFSLFTHLGFTYKALTPNRPQRPNSNHIAPYVHPHINLHGSACLGQMGRIIQRNLRNGELFCATVLAKEFLHNWGPGAYVPLREWQQEKLACSDCGRTVTFRGVHICTECRDVFCFRCRHKCKKCGTAICDACVNKVPHENKRRKPMTFCSECLEDIERWSREIKTDTPPETESPIEQ